MSADVSCMALGSVPAGEQRCRFLAVGLNDDTVRIISLDPQVFFCACKNICAFFKIHWLETNMYQRKSF